MKKYLLYPRLPVIDASPLAEEYANKEISELSAISDNTDHDAVKYSVTGTRVDDKDLEQLRANIMDIAAALGYPAVDLGDAERADFDFRAGQLLFEQLHLHPSEGSNIEIWTYMTCILMPHLVRWRFFDPSGTSTQRFLGSDRGVRRNTFGRLWWRVFLLRLDNDDPYLLLRELIEDELVQITERPSVSNNLRFVQNLALTHLDALEYAQESGQTVNRRELMRDAVKRIRRVTSFTMLYALDEQIQVQVVRDAYRRSLTAFGIS